MARTCQIARERKREKLIQQYAERRKAFKKAQVDFNLSDEERAEAVEKLAQLPRDSAPGRYTRRCEMTGAPRSVYRKFKLNRISFRKMALDGMLPGVTKSSW